MKLKPIGMIIVGCALAGCATSSNLPAGARLVGGGLKIDYSSAVPGTVILMERTSGRIVATETLEAGSSFRFNIDSTEEEKTMSRLFGVNDSASLDEKFKFQLYFVPSKEAKE